MCIIYGIGLDWEYVCEIYWMCAIWMFGINGYGIGFKWFRLGFCVSLEHEFWFLCVGMVVGL